MATNVDSTTAQPAVLTGLKQILLGTVVSEVNREHLLAVLARFITFAVPAFAFALSIHQIKGGWDDGAITAAFSRTLAESGRFALTPFSEKVEGFSSVTWVCLLAVPYYLFHSAVAVLVWMKLLSAVFFLLALMIVRRLAGRLLENAEQADLTTILAALIICPLLETLNGMEMNFFMFLVLCLVDVLTDEQRRQGRALLIWAFAFGLIATRFESPFLLAALLVGLLLSRDVTTFSQMSGGAATAFGMMELWRYHEFGVWMPNTIYAKVQPPYSPPHLLIPMIWTRISATDEIATVLGGPLLALLFIATGISMWQHLRLPWVGQAQRGLVRVLLLGASFIVVWHGLPYFAADTLTGNGLLISVGFELLAIVLILKACLGQQANRLEKLTAALVAAGATFGMLFGRNWGYPGRMILPCLPFLVLAIAHFISCHIPSEYWRRTALAGCVLCQLLTWTPGAWSAWAMGDQLPISAVEQIGHAGDAVRRLLNLDSLSILLPDVGGSSLCCERLRILDSALLANSYLAHNGYKSFDQYLHNQRPQVIETHGMWTAVTGVYRSELMSNYSLALVGNVRLLLRNDIYLQTYSRLEATTGVHMDYGAQCLGGIDPNSYYSFMETTFVKMRQSCLYISREDLLHNGISVE